MFVLIFVLNTYILVYVTRNLTGLSITNLVPDIGVNVKRSENKGTSPPHITSFLVLELKACELPKKRHEVLNAGIKGV